jgi:hypothetical protein
VEIVGDLLELGRSIYLAALGVLQEVRRHSERVARGAQGRLVVFIATRDAGAGSAVPLALEHADDPLEARVLLDDVRSQDVVDVDALEHDQAVDGGLQGPWGTPDKGGGASPLD